VPCPAHNQLAGPGGSVGSSGEVLGLSVGGEVNVNQGGRPSYTVSGGIGLPFGSPLEVHGYGTKTTVNEFK